jgi:hypothetical protein
LRPEGASVERHLALPGRRFVDGDHLRSERRSVTARAAIERQDGARFDLLDPCQRQVDIGNEIITIFEAD